MISTIQNNVETAKAISKEVQTKGEYQKVYEKLGTLVDFPWSKFDAKYR